MREFPPTWNDLDAVLCHDWLTGMRGGERVLEILCEGFPHAPIITLIHNPRAVSDLINRHPVATSWLQKVPAIMKHYRWFLPFFPSAIEHLAVPHARLLISTSHCVAKGIKPVPGTVHVCYCFTPMRYAWTLHEEYFGANPALRLLAEPLLWALRRWDRRSSARVDRFVAISGHVRERIRRFYGRDADIVYPPVDTERCTPAAHRPGGFDLVVSALVPYKRIDLAVRVYTHNGYPLKIVGVGGDLRKLRSMAGRNIEFLEWLPDERVVDLYRTCRLLVFPGEEDFGIVPLEAQACGCPVVAYARGGALETIQDGVSGVFFQEQTAASLQGAIDRCATARWDPQAIRANAERFDVQTFIRGFSDSVSKALACRRSP
jgi:glycosyltransferase involved in cell wall biosynthesis